MGYEAKGKLHSVSETQQVSERFSKRAFVVELADNPKYPQLVQFQLTGDRCQQLDGFGVGEEVTIEFSLRGRQWEGPKGIKYFNSLDAWSIKPVGERVAKPANSRDVTSAGLDDDDQIPF